MNIRPLLRTLVALIAGISAWAAAGNSWAAPTMDMLWDAGFTGTSNISEFPPILITGSTDITANSDINLLIPSTSLVTWNTTDTSIEVLLSGTGAVSTTVSSFPVAKGGRVALLDVTADFDATTRVVITGLGVVTSVSDQAQTLLGMNWDGTNDNTLAANTNSIQSFTMWRGEFSSANNFSFKNSDATPTLPTITVTEAAATPLSITSLNGILITIPNSATFGTAPTFSTTVTTVTVTGSGSGHVLGTGLTYSNGNRTVTIPVASDFGPGESVTLAGLQFATIANAYTADSLQLSLDAGATVKAVDKRVFAIGYPAITVSAMPTVTANAASQALQDASAVPVAVTTTITDKNGAITAASDIRLMIMGISNSGATNTGRDNLTWVSNLALVSSISGTGAILSPPIGVFDSGNNGNLPTNQKGRLMTIDVTTSFAANAQLAITGGLNANNSTGTATKLYIGLIIQGFTTNNASKAFGRVVSIATDSNLTGAGSSGSGGATRGTGGGGVCFLRAAQRPSSQ